MALRLWLGMESHWVRWSSKYMAFRAICYDTFEHFRIPWDEIEIDTSQLILRWTEGYQGFWPILWIFGMYFLHGSIEFLWQCLLFSIWCHHVVHHVLIAITDHINDHILYIYTLKWLYHSSLTLNSTDGIGWRLGLWHVDTLWNILWILMNAEIWRFPKMGVPLKIDGLEFWMIRGYPHFRKASYCVLIFCWLT